PGPARRVPGRPPRPRRSRDGRDRPRDGAASICRTRTAPSGPRSDQPERGGSRVPGRAPSRRPGGRGARRRGRRSCEAAFVSCGGRPAGSSRGLWTPAMAEATVADVADVAEALPASTVSLLRDETGPDTPFSVLMLERHGSVTFPGVHAFPGGVVDPGDHEIAGARLPADQTWAPAGGGDAPHQERPDWVAAIREVFEEVGVLLARLDDRLWEGARRPQRAPLR